MLKNLLIYFSRIIAYFIDYFIITLLQLPISFVFDVTLATGFQKDNSIIFSFQIFLFIILLICMFYIHTVYFFYTYNRWSASLGKKLFSLEVKTDLGEKLSLKQTFQREIILKILFFFVPFSWIMMVFRKDGKMLHDIYCQQHVIKT
jgi:uncharacterized RDD family membrane protein YckC